MGSKPLAINKKDLIKVGEGALLAMVGALFAATGLYLQSGVFDLKMFLGALGSILINVGRKFFTQT